MSLSTRTYTFTDGTTAYGSQVEVEIGALSTLFNSLDAATTAWTNVKGGTIQATTLLKGVGTNTNDSAATGYIGEWIQSPSVLGNYTGTTGTYANVNSISLTAGDWDVTGICEATLNGAANNTYMMVAVSAYSANTTTDHVEGDNVSGTEGPTTGVNRQITIASWRVSIATTTIIYLKVSMDFTAGTLKVYGRISARRVR